MAEQAAHNRLVEGSNPSGPIQTRRYELNIHGLQFVIVHFFLRQSYGCLF